MAELTCLPCLDSDELATIRRRELGIDRARATELGQSAVLAAREGAYQLPDGRTIQWRSLVQAARTSKRSIAPETALPEPPASADFPVTVVQVRNETTLAAAWRLTAQGEVPLALNFANGVSPGGGFLMGARAQEETLCRCSALYETLLDDRMYRAHAVRPHPDSTDWAIYSPVVPVFRHDDGTALEKPWLLSFLTCAAPVARRVGQPRSRKLLRSRIRRVLAISRACGHTSLVLGAWGCGAFGNDPRTTAEDFRSALDNEFSGAFRVIIFAISDWSPERATLGPFRDVFSP